MMEQEIENMIIHPGKEDLNIQHGIEELEKFKNIVIRPSDKGGAIVILDKDDYHKELNRFISDENACEKFKKGPY